MNEYLLKQNLKRNTKLIPQKSDILTIDLTTDINITMNSSDKKNKIAILLAINPNLIETFIKQCPWYNHYIVVFPNNSVYYSLFTQYNFKKLFGNKKYKPISYDSLELLRDCLLSNLEKLNFSIQGVSFFVLDKPIWQKKYSDVLNFIYESIDYMFNHEITNLNTNVYFNELILFNEYYNIKQCFKYPLISSLKAQHEGFPIVCIASGASLHKNIKYLKTIQKDVFIICCLNSLKTVLKEGIMPDLVTTLDMSPEMEKFADQVYDIPLAMEVSSYYGMKKYFPKIIFGLSGIKNKPHMKKMLEPLNLDNCFEIQTSFSVAFFSVNLAIYMGASEVILLGQDLSVSGEYSHAEGHAYNKKVDLKEYPITIKSWDTKGTVQTNSMFDTFRKFFEFRLTKMTTPVINCTEGGCYIEGTEHITLKEAHKKYIRTCDKKNVYKTIEPIKKEFPIDKYELILQGAKEAVGWCEELYFADKMPNPDMIKLKCLSDKINKLKNIIMNDTELMGIVSENKYTLFSLYEYALLQREKMTDTQTELIIFFLSVIQNLEIAVNARKEQ